jgi:hypothetical protein
MSGAKFSRAGVRLKATIYSSASPSGTKSAVWSNTYVVGAAVPVVRYTPSASTAGRYLTLGLVAAKDGYNSWSGATAAYQVKGAACKSPVSAVTAWSAKRGKPKAGKKVQLTPTVTRVAGTKVTYTWKAGKKVVKKASSTRALKLKKAWRGKKLTVVVTVTAPGNSPITRTITFGKIK